MMLCDQIIVEGNQSELYPWSVLQECMKCVYINFPIFISNLFQTSLEHARNVCYEFHVTEGKRLTGYSSYKYIQEVTCLAVPLQ